MIDPDDDLPTVELARVMVERDGDGELVYSAMAQDWVSLHTKQDIAVMLSMAASALDLLAESFDPDVNKTELAPVLSLATARKDDDRK